MMGTTLLLAEFGEDFFLSSMQVWEKPLAVGLSLTL